MFRRVEVDELCRIAGSGRQVRHAPRDALLREGVVPDTLHVLLDGSLRAQGRADESRTLTPPTLVGFEWALEARPATETVRADGPAVTLAISRDELLTLLSGSTDLVQGLFRTIIGRETATAEALAVVRGTLPEQVAGFGTTPASPIQRVLALRQVPLFAQVSSEELFQLGAIAREEPLEPGRVLSDETDPPVLCIVLRGALALEGGGGLARRTSGFGPIRVTPSASTRPWPERPAARSGAILSGSSSRKRARRCGSIGKSCSI